MGNTGVRRWRATLCDLDGTMYDYHPSWEQGTRAAITERLTRFPTEVPS